MFQDLFQYTPQTCSRFAGLGNVLFSRLSRRCPNSPTTTGNSYNIIKPGTSPPPPSPSMPQTPVCVPLTGHRNSKLQIAARYRPARRRPHPITGRDCVQKNEPILCPLFLPSTGSPVECWRILCRARASDRISPLMRVCMWVFIGREGHKRWFPSRSAPSVANWMDIIQAAWKYGDTPARTVRGVFISAHNLSLPAFN